LIRRQLFTFVKIIHPERSGGERLHARMRVRSKGGSPLPGLGT